MKYQTKEWLTKKYITEELSQEKVARLAGIDRCTIAYWMKKHKIRVRTRAEVKLLQRRKLEEKRKNETLQRMDFKDEDDLASVEEVLETERLFEDNPGLMRALMEREMKEMQTALAAESRRQRSG